MAWEFEPPQEFPSVSPEEQARRDEKALALRASESGTDLGVKDITSLGKKPLPKSTTKWELEQPQEGSVQSVIAQQPTKSWIQGMVESLTANQPKEPFSWKDVGVGTVLGAGIGGIVGGPAGAVVGGVEGTAGGIADEYAGTKGASPLTRFGTSMSGGMLGLGFVRGAQKIAGLKNYRARLAADLIGVDKVNTANEDIVNLRAKEKLFGKETARVYNTSQNFDESQTRLAQTYLPQGTPVVGRKVSDAYRENLMSDIDKIEFGTRQNVIPAEVRKGALGEDIVVRPSSKQTVQDNFINSPQYKELMGDLGKLIKVKDIDSSDVSNLNDILRLSSDKDPSVRAQYGSRLLNLIQNGGVRPTKKMLESGVPETEQLINTFTQQRLRQRYNEFLRTKVGDEAYNTLKNIEKEEFLAEARDAIPSILNTGFTAGKNEQMDVLRSFVNPNNPYAAEGKQEFTKALYSHFSQLGSEKEFNSALNAVRPVLLESKTFNRKEIDGLYQKFAQFNKEVDAEKRLLLKKQVMTGLLASGIKSTAGQNPSSLEIKKVWSL